MQCPQCQHENREGAKFCDECGSPLALHCPACETENRPGAKFCNECGTSLAASTLAPTSIPSQQQPAAERALETTQEAQPPPVEPSSAEPRTPEAERRQLTVMFCDLADSTKLSSQLDPEDLRDVIRAYQSTSADVIERYDGHIAQHLGDGLMVYFGWPQAHEDDAQRAVHAGLGILEAMAGLNARLEQEKGIRLAVRIGIHTGLVVVGEIGQGASQEHLALGETPNIASRIEGIAQPDTVAISDATYQLVQGYFVCKDPGLHTLKGVDEPRQVYRVVSASEAQSRLDVAATRGLTPLIGRESEVTLLLERWQQVRDGQGQVVLLSGEAGIGKSRLLQVMKDHVAGEAHTLLECRSSPYYQNTALYPITDLLQRSLMWQQDDTPQEKLDKLEQTLREYRLELDEAIPLFANLLSLPIPEDRYSPLALSPQRQRQKTLESILAMLLQQTEQQPVLFILEDLHWTDPSTLELLGLLVDQAPTVAICVLLTCRPAFQPPWSSRSYSTQMTFNRLSRSQIEQMAERVAGSKRLPDEVLQQIVEKTDGVPLFVEEMTKAVLESGVLKEVNGQYELAGRFSSLAIPSTLQDSLMARLDRLVSAKRTAQMGAVIGRQFSYELLHAVLQLDESTLQRELGRIVEAELLYQRGLPPRATYTFKHALIQDAAYQSLLKSTRHQYHQRIAEYLVAQSPETVEAQPELVAHHYTEAGCPEPAATYWQHAGQRAMQRSALVEAMAHLTQGLEVLTVLPETPQRLRRELNLHQAIGPALMVTRGAASPQVAQTYARIEALAEHLKETPRGLWLFYYMRGEIEMAQQHGAQLMELAQRLQDPSLLFEAHMVLGFTLLRLGDVLPACTHLEQGIALYDPQQHHVQAFLYAADPGVMLLCYAARALWLLGYPAQALERSQEALKLAHELSHPFSQVYALTWTAVLQQLCHDWQAVQQRAEEVITLATEQGFPFLAEAGAFAQGWVCIEQGQVDEGIAQMAHSLAGPRAAGMEQGLPFSLGLLADAYARTGQTEEGLALLAEGLAVAQRSGGRYWESELRRLQGELLLHQRPSDVTQAERYLSQALDTARRQQAKSWELRAAMSLSRLWQRQERRQDAYQLLAEVYGGFTEGFDTADLQEAQALLEVLREG